MVNVRPLAMLMAPLVLNDAGVPDWMTVRSPPVMLMVPVTPLRCADEPPLMVRLWSMMSVPWLSSWAFRAALVWPPVSADAWMVLPAGLLSVPLVTFSVAGWGLLLVPI